MIFVSDTSDWIMLVIDVVCPFLLIIGWLNESFAKKSVTFVLNQIIMNYMCLLNVEVKHLLH